MKFLVTGATGKVGNAVARRLADRGDEVVALVRDLAKARELLPAGVELASGDVTDTQSIRKAADGAEGVFNCMGLFEQWFADPGIFERVNAEGARNVIAAARNAGVRRAVHTSTFDVFHANTGGTVSENAVADYPKGTAYERSKQHAEELVLAERNGMEVVILNPSGVYGPTPSPTPSFENGLFEPVVRKRLPAVPPGGTGYAFVEGVAAGHLLAAEKGIDGERYILADGYASFRDLAETVKRVAGRGRIPPTMPIPVAKAIASIGAGVSRVIRRPPLLPKGQLTYFLWQARPDSSKAQRELGWKTTPLDEGVHRTLHSMGLLETS
jgi:dihydroflavonol-4-reductase